MKQETLKYLKDEITKFEDMTKKFVNKEITMKDYKGFSGGYGSYAQRGGERFMLRLRMNQGVMSKDKLNFLIDTLNQYDVEKVHLTTCQTFQLHNVLPEHLGDIMRNALDHDIVTRGGGGDFPRNVMCSPLSGVEEGEYFDVLPYAKAVGEYLLEEIHTYHLPRKLKVAFANSEKNKTHATFRDLGFCANEDGTFDVYIAGGLGNNPKLGVLVGEHIAKEDVLYYTEAMVQTFLKHGNYENRAKARTRYMQESLGIDGLKEAFATALAEVRKQDLTLRHVVETTITKTGTKEITNKHIIKQKQKGLYAIHVHPKGGDLTLSVMKELAKAIKDMEAVELRISPQQDLYIINLTAQEAEMILPVLTCFANTRFERSVSCIGATICQVGLRDSQSLLHKMLEAAQPYNFQDGVLPLIHISGCTSSCGTHQVADMGFQGSVKLVNQKPQNAFVMSIHGNDTRSDAQFGTVCGTMLEARIPDFIVALGKRITEINSTFDAYTKEHQDEFQALVNEYCND